MIRRLFNIASKKNGGANVEYALFMAALSIIALSALLAAGDQLRPNVVAWEDDAPLIDNTLTGSITPDAEGTVSKKVEGENTLRIIQLPRALRTPEDGRFTDE